MPLCVRLPEAYERLKPEKDRMNEECGVFGIHGIDEDVSKLTFYGLFSLQHRGQESAGIASTDGTKIRLYRDMGLVNQIFQEDILATLKGFAAIGHTRYSTTGSSVLRNVQPMLCECDNLGELAVAHN